MKICFLTHNLRQDNGAGVFSRRLITGMRDALSADVVALTTVPGGEPYERAILAPNKLRLLARIPQIRAIIRDCDVIHALDVFPYGLIGAIASIGLRKRLIITAIGSGSILPLYSRLYAPLARRAYRRAAVITAISAFTRDEILKKIPGLQITVINPGVDRAEFQKQELGIGDQDAAAIQNYKPYILSVGQLRWRKGYHLSIRSFANVAPHFPHLNYVIVGKRYADAYERRLQNLIAELGLQNRVHILQEVESRETLIGIYKNAELFCLFSQNIKHDVEGFGLVFLEAAAAGLPVVGSKNCGIDDAVRDGGNGILVPTRDPDDFAGAIIKILGDENMKRRMGEQSLAFAQVSGWSARIGQYVDIYGHFVYTG